MAFVANNRKWLGYILYVALITLAMLYYLFPEQSIEEFVDNSVGRLSPGLGFKAEQIVPWLPAGLRINAGRILLDNGTASEVFKADSMYIGPRIMQLVRGEYSIDLSGRAYAGEIDGWLHLKDGSGETVESEVAFKDFDLAEYEFLVAKLKHRVTGKVSGDIVYAGESADAGGNGKANLKLVDGQLQLQTPIFGIASIDLRNIDLELELRKRTIAVVKAELSGSEMKGSMTGSIQLQPDINSSQLNLKGTLEPLTEFYQNYPEVRELLKSMKKRVKRGQYFFAISGTLGEPRFRLL